MFVIAYDFCYPRVWSLGINMSTEYMVLGPRQGTPLENVVIAPQRNLCWAVPPVLFLVPLWSNNLALRASGLTSVQLHPIEQTCKSRKLTELCTQTSLLLDGHVLSVSDIREPGGHLRSVEKCSFFRSETVLNYPHYRNRHRYSFKNKYV